MPHIPVFDLGAAETLDTARPHQATRKLWSMVFLLAIKDMATVVRYAPHRGPHALTYQVDGVYQQLVPPAKQISTALIDEIASLVTSADSNGQAGWLTRWLPWRAGQKPSLPIKALVELKVGDKVVDAIVSVFETDLGREVVAYLVDATPEYGPRSEASHTATEVFRRMFAAKNRAPGDESIP
ncbi:MAG TPA: hypothetical protein VGZ22_02025 [Isosphaeraceae bacterium]|jgi:hypothetical protein|nr:hypothetical protein [Isosphaeraceae bacterium]